MRFTPVTPDRLVHDLARWIDALEPARPRIGVDGAAEIGAGALADAVADRLRAWGRPVIRSSTSWWWRSASLRLEFGRTDVDMLLGGWVDTGALRRELLDPLAPGGTGIHLRRLRDPDSDRSVRDPRQQASERTVLLLDGPFLQSAGLPLDGVVHLTVAPGTLARSLPADRQWWVAANDRYGRQDRPLERASVVVAYDHPASPALAWAPRPGSFPPVRP